MLGGLFSRTLVKSSSIVFHFAASWLARLGCSLARFFCSERSLERSYNSQGPVVAGRDQFHIALADGAVVVVIEIEKIAGERGVLFERGTMLRPASRGARLAAGEVHQRGQKIDEVAGVVP